MSFGYNNAIPASGNNPSNDQPLMLQNFASIQSWTAVDHVSFAGNATSNTGAGQHLQTTFNSKNTPGVLVDPVSVLYTQNGTASNVSLLTYNNSNGNFPLSIIKAYANINNGGAINAAQSFNVMSAVRNSVGTYTITLANNPVVGVAYSILIGSTVATSAPQAPCSYSYQITSSTTFILRFTSLNAQVDVNNFCFIVIQI